MNTSRTFEFIKGGILLLGLFLYLTFGISLSNAESISTTIADASFINVKFSQTKARVWEISFDLVNKGNETLTGIRYGIQAVDTRGGKQVILDESIFSDVVSLSPGKIAHRETTYLPPSSILPNVPVTFFLLARTASGLPVAVNGLGTFPLANLDNEYLNINPESCFVEIISAGIKDSNRHYVLDGAISVSGPSAASGGDNLQLTCQVKSTFNSEINVSPKITTRIQSAFGDPISENILNKILVSIPPNEKVLFSTNIITIRSPQNYEVKVSLVDNDGKSLTNEITVKYAVKGLFAQIDSVSFDNESYKKGESANLKVAWSAGGSSQAGRQPRTTIGENAKSIPDFSIMFSLEDERGQICATDQKISLRKLAQPGNINFQITKSCPTPILLAKILDDKGRILFEDKYYAQGEGRSSGISTNFTLIVIIAVVIIIVVVLGRVFGRRKKNYDFETV